jgi:hypothetical protein
MSLMVAPGSGRSQLLRRFKAAIVLAALYTLGVATFLAVLAATDGDWRLYIDSVRSTAASFGVLFGIAFVILAFARRIGFVALWVLLCTLWILLLRDGLLGGGGYALPFEFVKWSVFALPLYLIGFMAVPRAIHIKIGNRRVPPVLVVGGLWVVLAVAGFILRDYAYPPQYMRITEDQSTAFERVNVLGWVFWAPVPFVIAAISVAAMWVASRGGRLDEGGLTSARS